MNAFTDRIIYHLARHDVLLSAGTYVHIPQWERKVGVADAPNFLLNIRLGLLCQFQKVAVLMYAVYALCPLAYMAVQIIIIIISNLYCAYYKKEHRCYNKKTLQ